MKSFLKMIGFILAVVAIVAGLIAGCIAYSAHVQGVGFVEQAKVWAKVFGFIKQTATLTTGV